MVCVTCLDFVVAADCDEEQSRTGIIIFKNNVKLT